MELPLAAAGRGRDARADRPAAQLPARGTGRRPGRPRARAVRRQSLLRLRDGPRVVREGRDHAQRLRLGAGDRGGRRFGPARDGARRDAAPAAGAAAQGAAGDRRRGGDRRGGRHRPAARGRCRSSPRATCSTRSMPCCRGASSARRATPAASSSCTTCSASCLTATSRPRAAAACTAASASGSRSAGREARPSRPPCWPTTSRMPRTGPKAFAYTMEAAEAAINAYAFNNAITHLNDALELLPGRRRRMRRATASGTCSARPTAPRAGSTTRSGPTRAALEHAGDGIARATANHGIGEAYHRKGAYDDAVRHFDLALREVGYPRPRSRPGASSTSGGAPSTSTCSHPGSIGRAAGPTASDGSRSPSRPTTGSPSSKPCSTSTTILRAATGSPPSRSSRGSPSTTPWPIPSSG